MPDAHPEYRQLITACDNLMKNSKLSLYEEVGVIKAKAHSAKANDVGILNQLTSDLSFLIDRLSSTEKRTYLGCCEAGKVTKMWDSTEP
jgi:hypothetical protein